MTDLAADAPTDAEFTSECQRFLEPNFESHSATRSAFAWGVGSDAVALFDEDVPLDRGGDDMGAVREWRTRLASAGLAWICGPSRYGGRGLPLRYQRIFDAEAARFAVPGNRKLVISLGMVAPTILAHGTEQAKARYLRGLHDGRLIACQLFSEPGAGSDLAAVSTRAEKRDGAWRLSGQKVWTSGAHFSDIGLVLCRTGGSERHGNLTMFLIDMHAHGVDVRPLRQMTGGAAFNEVFLDDVEVADDDRLGEVGDGWQVAITTLSAERSSVGGDGFGGAGLLSVDRYVEMLRARGRADDPVMRQRLADLVINLTTAKYNGRRAGDARRAGNRPGPEGSLGKLTLTANYGRISEFVGSLLGPELIADGGMWGTYAWTEFLLGVPGMRIGGGTDEIQKNIIAERILGLPRTEART